MIVTSKYIIVHGQLREITDNELMHWKYIKREKVNGKWRYYYDNSANKLSSLKKDIMDLEYERNNKYRSYISKLKSEDYARANDDWERKNVDSWYSNKSIMDHERRYFDRDGKGKYITYNIERAKDKIEKHSKTIAGKVDTFMSKNGYKIAKSLNEVSTKIDKAKNYIKSLFSRR